MKNKQMVIFESKQKLVCAVAVEDIIKLRKGDKIVDVLLTDSKTVNKMKGK